MARLLIFMVLALWSVLTFAQDLVTASDRVTTHVNIRATASEDAAQIGQLRIGEGLPLIRSVPRWHEEQLAAGQSGFVSKAFTTIAAATFTFAPAGHAQSAFRCFLYVDPMSGLGFVGSHENGHSVMWRCLSNGLNAFNHGTYFMQERPQPNIALEPARYCL